MEATVTEIYNHSESYTNETEYTARNTACFNLFTHLAANPPTGWTVSSSSIPSVSTTAYQVFYVILEGQGFRVKFYTSSSGTYKTILYADVQNTSGTAILTATGTSTNVTIAQASGSYQYQFNITLTSYATTNKLYALMISSSQGSTKRVVAKIYTTNKSTGAEDFVVASDFYSLPYVGLMTAATTKALWCQFYYTKNESGQYGVIPTLLLNDSTYYYYAELINTKMASGTDALTPGGVYTDGADSYLRIGKSWTSLIKL